MFNQIKILLFENDLRVDLNEFRSRKEHTEKFWNLIYYFNEYHLPFEFILPYQNKNVDKYLKKYKSKIKKKVTITETRGAQD